MPILGANSRPDVVAAKVQFPVFVLNDLFKNGRKWKNKVFFKLIIFNKNNFIWPMFDEDLSRGRIFFPIIRVITLVPLPIVLPGSWQGQQFERRPWDSTVRYLSPCDDSFCSVPEVFYGKIRPLGFLFVTSSFFSSTFPPLLKLVMKLSTMEALYGRRHDYRRVRLQYSLLCYYGRWTINAIFSVPIQYHQSNVVIFSVRALMAPLKEGLRGGIPVGVKDITQGTGNLIIW